MVPGTHTAENHDFISSDQGSRSSISKFLLCATRAGTVKYYAQIHLQVWQHANKSTMYLYDRGGNMTGYLSAPYTTAPSIDGVMEMVFYSYDDANWKDKVTAIDGKAITYDAIGNPLTYDGWTFTWKAGRMLDSMVKTGTNAQFTYDHNGMRIKKIVNNMMTIYKLNGKNIVHMTQGSNDLHFFYDAQGKPAMVRFGNAETFHVCNQQGYEMAPIDQGSPPIVVDKLHIFRDSLWPPRFPDK